MAAQPEEAIELYMAADRPRQALAILNQQLSSAMERGVEEAVSGRDVTGAGEGGCMGVWMGALKAAAIQQPAEEKMWGGIVGRGGEDAWGRGGGGGQLGVPPGVESA